MSELLYIPIILGTVRQGRNSENVARFVAEQVCMRPDVETEVIDLRTLPFPMDDEGESIKNEDFSAAMARADGIILIVPEYNHSFPGLLKHALDTNLKEYIHKAVGVCGVSAGGFGGTRVIQSLLPVLRELGLVTIFWDGNFSNAYSLFDGDGRITDPSYAMRMEKFIAELVWMSRTLRYGREEITLV